MPRLDAAYEGEDVPVTVTYEDDSGTATEPDAAPTITITDPDDTEQVSAISMTSVETGVYEHVWDTSTNAAGAGEYDVEITAEFSTEVKIAKATIELV